MPTRSPAAAALPERRLRHHVVAADPRPQAHRAAVSRRRHVLLLRRRRVRGADPARAGDAGRRPGHRRDLQQAVHDARRDDGVLLPHPGDPRRARQLPRADHDRREGPRVSEAEPRELVHLHDRRRCSRCTRSSPAASTPAGRSTRRSARVSSTTQRDPDGARHLHHRLLVDPHRPQLHRHHPPDARARA